MSENSKIEWTDHTFNPWEGCQKVGPGLRLRTQLAMDSVNKALLEDPRQTLALFRCCFERRQRHSRLLNKTVQQIRRGQFGAFLNIVAVHLDRSQDLNSKSQFSRRVVRQRYERQQFLIRPLLSGRELMCTEAEDVRVCGAGLDGLNKSVDGTNHKRELKEDRCCRQSSQVVRLSLSAPTIFCGQPYGSNKGADRANGANPYPPVGRFHVCPRGRRLDMPHKQQHADEREKANCKCKKGKAPVVNFLMHEDPSVKNFQIVAQH